MIVTSKAPGQVQRVSEHYRSFNEYRAYQTKGYLLKNTYKHVNFIEKGSFGEVTLALNTITNEKVAMKAMLKKDKYGAQVAAHEISILEKLGVHENVCLLVDWFETNDFIILVLEYCSEGDLYEMIHTHRLPLASVDVYSMAKQLSNGIRYAHSLGIYHRDIKPENVLFNSAGQLKICDWGLATTQRHSTDFDVGTEKYMAPECFASSTQCKRYDCKYADYWSLGVTLLTALFGTSPFKPICVDGQKSLVSDSNFKKFVFYSQSDLLYDIYPMMNRNCYDIFMNLLRVGGVEDDAADYRKKISSRSLSKFLKQLENNWRFGLTTDEQDDYDDDAAANVFDMDEHLPVEEPRPHHDINGNVTTPEPVAPAQLPSLVESTVSKSWVDYDDEPWDLPPLTVAQTLPAKTSDIHIVGSWSDY